MGNRKEILEKNHRFQNHFRIHESRLEPFPPSPHDPLDPDLDLV